MIKIRKEDLPLTEDKKKFIKEIINGIESVVTFGTIIECEYFLKELSHLINRYINEKDKE